MLFSLYIYFNYFKTITNMAIIIHLIIVTTPNNATLQMLTGHFLI